MTLSIRHKHIHVKVEQYRATASQEQGEPSPFPRGAPATPPDNGWLITKRGDRLGGASCGWDCRPLQAAKGATPRREEPRASPTPSGTPPDNGWLAQKRGVRPGFHRSCLSSKAVGRAGACVRACARARVKAEMGRHSRFLLLGSRRNRGRQSRQRQRFKQQCDAYWRTDWSSRRGRKMSWCWMSDRLISRGQ